MLDLGLLLLNSQFLPLGLNYIHNLARDIIIIIILVIKFLQGIYNYIPATNLVSKVYSVAPVLYLQFVLHVMLFRLWNMFCTFMWALSIVFAQCLIWLFFFVVPYFHAFLLCCSGIVWVILKWFQSPVLLIVSLLLSYSTCAEFLLRDLHIFKSDQLISWSHFCLRNCNIYVHVCSFFMIMDYDVWFIGRNNSVGLHFLVP